MQLRFIQIHTEFKLLNLKLTAMLKNYNMIILTQNKIINEFVDDVKPGDFETEHFDTKDENLFDPVHEENEKKLKELSLSKETAVQNG